MLRRLIAVAVLLAASSANAEPITVVSFNAENLFDTVDDADNPHDNTYLPLAIKQAAGAAHESLCKQNNPNTASGNYKQCINLDWSEATYKIKLKRYADVVSAMPALPHVITIPETENAKVLDDLKAILPKANEWSVIQLDTSDEPDSRGIDVGILTRLPINGTPVAHKVVFAGESSDCRATRDIVQASLKLSDGAALTVFGVHFPSGGNPYKCRLASFAKLNEITAALPKDDLKIAAGDFNLNCLETQTDAMDRLLVKGNWYLSPLATAGCSAPGSSKFIERGIDNWNTWSFLDLILVSNTLSLTQPSINNWFADLGSFGTLVVSPEQVMVDREDKGFVEPRRFDPVTGRGVSDHWPVMIRLVNRRG
jgi:endonuclease/exonuclease/phosphatase family metal-dependent hydrolase